MTIKLLCAYGQWPANAIVTLDAPTEAGLVAAKMATSDTTGGVPFVAPVSDVSPRQVKYDPDDGTFSAEGSVLPIVTGKTDPVTGGIAKIWTGTQAQYDAIATKATDTLYVIVAG